MTAMIAVLRPFDQSLLERMREVDPVVQRYRARFALFDWNAIDPPEKRGPGHPKSAYIKAALVRIKEHLLSTSRGPSLPAGSPTLRPGTGLSPTRGLASNTSTRQSLVTRGGDTGHKQLIGLRKQDTHRGNSGPRFEIVVGRFDAHALATPLGEKSPTLTGALASMEMRTVAASLSAAALTRLTCSKIASLAASFFGVCSWPLWYALPDGGNQTMKL